jgi:hypothetical protein
MSPDSSSIASTTGVSETPPAPDWRAPRWVVLLFALGAVALAPWTILLVVALPSMHRAEHWDVAWAGFDVGLALLLGTVALTAWRRSPWLQGAAAATATLLVVDAWFDVLTSSGGADRVVAVGEAFFVELPLAVLCLLLARGAERWSRVPLARRAVNPVRLRLVLGERASAEPARGDDRLSA